jgi:hypothetical protein
MTGAGFDVVWNGGPLLPDRPERTMLPICRDEEYDLINARQDRADRPPDPMGRCCACGCGAVLPKRARRRGRSIQFRHGHHRKGLPSPLRGRVRT